VEGFMTTKRVPIVRSRAQQITPHAVDLFRYAMELEDNGSPVGSAEHNRIAVELHRELGRKVWDVNLFDVHVDDPPPRDFDSMRFASWETAIALRAELEQAVAEHERAAAGPVTMADLFP
jgi:hypothetical protein